MFEISLACATCFEMCFTRISLQRRSVWNANVGQVINFGSSLNYGSGGAISLSGFVSPRHCSLCSMCTTPISYSRCSEYRLSLSPTLPLIGLLHPKKAHIPSPALVHTPGNGPLAAALAALQLAPCKTTPTGECACGTLWTCALLAAMCGRILLLSAPRCPSRLLSLGS